MAGRDLTKNRKIGPRIIFMYVEGYTTPDNETKPERIYIADDAKFRQSFERINKNTFKRLFNIFENYDILVTWSEKDVPLLTAWALRLGLNPSPIHNLTHLDLARFVKENLMLDGTSLEKTAEFLRVKPQPIKINTLVKVFKKLHRFIRDIMPELAL